MATPQQAAEILAGGAINFGRFALERGVRPSNLFLAFRREYPELTELQAKRFARITLAARTAGQRIMQLGVDVRPRIQDIPINTQLFGGENLGRRFEFSVLVEFRGQGQTESAHRRIIVESGIPLSPQMLLNEIGTTVTDQYKGNVQLLPGTTVQDIFGVDVELAQRAF